MASKSNSQLRLDCSWITYTRMRVVRPTLTSRHWPTRFASEASGVKASYWGMFCGKDIDVFCCFARPQLFCENQVDGPWLIHSIFGARRVTSDVLLLETMVPLVRLIRAIPEIPGTSGTKFIKKFINYSLVRLSTSLHPATRAFLRPTRPGSLPFNGRYSLFELSTNSAALRLSDGARGWFL